MDLATATEEVRARLQELVADFWTPDEVLRAINEGVNRFAQEEKWPYLLTVGTAVIESGEPTFDLEIGVSFNRHFNLLITFDGEQRPRWPNRVTPTEGFRLRKVYYTDSSEPLAYYLYSQINQLSNEFQRITNDGSQSGNFTLTYDGQTTANIARGSSATTVRTRLIALSNIGAADVSTTGGPLGVHPVGVHFRGALAAADLPEMTLGGTTTDMTIETVQEGGAGIGVYVPTVRLVPGLSRDADVEYQYIRDPISVVDDADSLDIPEEYAMAVPAYAAGHLFLKELSTSQKADEQFSLYRKIVEDAKRDLRKLTADQGFAWGRNQPEYGPLPDDWFTQLVTPPLLGS